MRRRSPPRSTSASPARAPRTARRLHRCNRTREAVHRARPTPAAQGEARAPAAMEAAVAQDSRRDRVRGGMRRQSVRRTWVHLGVSVSAHQHASISNDTAESARVRCHTQNAHRTRGQTPSAEQIRSRRVPARHPVPEARLLRRTRRWRSKPRRSARRRRDRRAHRQRTSTARCAGSTRPIRRSSVPRAPRRPRSRAAVRP